MRLWDLRLIKYLPELQFKGQLRELIAIMHNWRDKGKTNHLLINKVMEYPKRDLSYYFVRYEVEYHKRYGKWLNKQFFEFDKFYRAEEDKSEIKPFFDGWLNNNNEYLRVCMANLYEKYKFGVGKSKITDKEWERLLQGYYEITNEQYNI